MIEKETIKWLVKQIQKLEWTRQTFSMTSSGRPILKMHSINLLIVKYAYNSYLLNELFRAHQSDPFHQFLPFLRFWRLLEDLLAQFLPCCLSQPRSNYFTHRKTFQSFKITWLPRTPLSPLGPSGPSRPRWPPLGGLPGIPGSPLIPTEFIPPAQKKVNPLNPKKLLIIYKIFTFVTFAVNRLIRKVMKIVIV